MEEILPGVHHWSAMHQGIGTVVHSYAIGTTLVDPLLPPEGLDALPGPVSQILLTNRHHYRSSDAIVARFRCPVRCHEAGLHEFSGTDRVVEGFTWGDRLDDDIVAVKLDAICDEETVLHVQRGDGALAFADGLVEWEGSLGFVPDFLLGEDPEDVKARLRDGLAALLDLEFDALLLAHGEPVVGGGKDALRRFLAS